MSNSILIDTNVLIYAVDADSQFHHRAWNILLDPEVRLFTTSKNISEFLVVLTRDIEMGLSTDECLEILKELLRDIIVLYPTPKSFKIFEELIQKYNPRGLWIHDVEIASIGISYGVSTIVTRNVSDFRRIKEISIKEI
ncbi:hypothetical protein JCM12298_26410 [Desulfothermus naphthae]